MDNKEVTITIHMVSSLDGFVAKKDNSIGWFDTHHLYENGIQLTEEDRDSFLKGIDCYIMGSRTYAMANELSKKYGWAYGDTPVIVCSQHEVHSERNSVQGYPGDLKTLINEKIMPAYKNVWVVGGPSIANNFIREGLADELRISLLPIILGEGLPFLSSLQKEQLIQLKEIKAYRNGMVEMRYGFIK